MHHPRKAVFDDPPAGQHDEAGGVFWAADRIDGEVEVPFRLVDESAGVGGVGRNDRDFRVQQAKAEQHFLRCGSVVLRFCPS